MRLTVSAVVLAVLALTGCGSSASYPDEVRPAIQDMARAIRSYDAAAQSDAGTTARACRDAHQSLAADDALATTTAPRQYSRLGAELAAAFRLALAGFTDCAVGDYSHMVRAVDELARANAAIVQAKALDY